MQDCLRAVITHFAVRVCQRWSRPCWALQLFHFLPVPSYYGYSKEELRYHRTDWAAKIIFISTSPSSCLLQPGDWESSQFSHCSSSVQPFQRKWGRLKWDKSTKTVGSSTLQESVIIYKSGWCTRVNTNTRRVNLNSICDTTWEENMSEAQWWSPD